MSGVSRFLTRAVRLAAVAGLLAAGGCSARSEKAAQIVLVRASGEVVSMLATESVDEVQAELDLTDDEASLLRALVERGSAAASTTESKPSCLTGSGYPPECFPINDCKECIVISVGLTSAGMVGATNETAPGEEIPLEAPFAFQCECTHN